MEDDDGLQEHPEITTSPVLDASKTKDNHYRNLLLIFLVLVIIGIGVILGIHFLVLKKVQLKVTPQLTHPPIQITIEPTNVNPTIPIGWKTYTNTAFGFSFSYPPDMTYLDSGSNAGNNNYIYIQFSDANKQQVLTVNGIDGNNLCNNGSTILTGEPRPTDPIKIAEATASCFCIAGSSQDGTDCSSGLEEQPFSSHGIIVKNAYQFFLQENLYKNGVKKSSDKKGPYTAFFFPNGAVHADSNGNGRNILGFYVELVNQQDLHMYTNILSTVSLSLPTVPPNSLRITFSQATTYEQAVAIVQNAGMQLVGPYCIGVGANPGIGVNISSTIDEHDLYKQSYTLVAGIGYMTPVTQTLANKIATSPQVTTYKLIHILLCD
jgi:hypothetical protein